MARVIVLDASILIAYLDEDDEHHDRSMVLLSREIGDDLAISPITLAEVLVAPTRDQRSAPVLTAITALEVASIPITVDSAVRLAQLRVTTRLRMPDCCVLLAAQDASARVASFDDRLLTAASAVGLIALGE